MTYWLVSWVLDDISLNNGIIITFKGRGMEVFACFPPDNGMDGNGLDGAWSGRCSDYSYAVEVQVYSRVFHVWLWTSLATLVHARSTWLPVLVNLLIQHPRTPISVLYVDIEQIMTLTNNSCDIKILKLFWNYYYNYKPLFITLLLEKTFSALHASKKFGSTTLGLFSLSPSKYAVQKLPYIVLKSLNLNYF